MSTENEGAAVPSAGGSQSGSPAPEEANAPEAARAPEPAKAPEAAKGATPPAAPAAGPAATEGGDGRTERFPAVPPHAPPAPGTPPPPADQGAWFNAAGAPAAYGATPQDGTGHGGPLVPPAAPWGAPEPPRRRRGGGLAAAVLVAALVAGAAGGGIGYWAANRSDTSSTTVSAPGDPKTASRTPGSVADIAAKALPNVVTIEAQSSGGEGGTGTGFVYDTEGHILTNNHVVASAADGGRLSVTFSNGKQYDAEVIGRAQGYDVAVIKLKNPSGAKLSPLPLGDSDKTAVGDATVAIGAPFGLSGTVTTGIVSAKNRPVASSDGGGSGNASYMSALQTDASINPGNSGGPLLNAQGAVIGINSAIQSANNGGGFPGAQGQSGSIGLGFAIPINQAKNVAEQLIKTGKPVYPVIGATVNMKDGGTGARVADNGTDGSAAVTPGGPADKAGLKPGDVIVKLGDTKIDSGPTLISEIWTHKPGTKVPITYVRNGKQTTTDIVLGERTGDK
ncbi:MULTISPECIES: S1C family serine protease [Streptomyces]|uniref:S1C family serine protease n=1 Tax=Streptomyces TaxID=1883 RepID=UPI00163C4C7C|nr:MULTISPECIES: trypsin-like peptidase domain-containing protein [Streptomyces]MBC2875913.1 trypsin-like peptidase domain-containing protein [Streptomyces sp. TYQ1024]UBI37756.1 trypsin-like peptidase domain-containing protein [Streptomyces mobaraensis]UKW30343.1 trypsin-like peptidase domain-containing protein [Streptomyces sp. TYQ1024]